MTSRPALPLHAPPGPMTPGRYLSMRCDASGLDQVEVAMAIASPAFDAEEAGVLLMRLQADEMPFDWPVDHHVFINLLEQAIRFDPSVYWALVAARTDPKTIVPPICRDCACTFFDPCTDERGACGWANAGSGEEPLCTHCEAKAETPAPSAPPAAGITTRGEPVHVA